MDPDQKISIQPEVRSRKKDSYVEILKFALIVLIIFLPIRLFIAKPFIVSGDSMVPTFQNGQYLIVDELTYDLSKPQRGDVIVFQYPYAPAGQTVYYIKRIIGLPNETVESKNGQITVINNANPNGFTLNEPYVINKSTDSFAPVTLGPDQYFVMGDNRPASSDSRFWGPLEAKYIVGRPFFRLLPPTTIGILPGSYHQPASQTAVTTVANQ